MINLPGLGIENALPILTSLQWPNHRTDKQANSIYPSLRVCFFIPLQSFIMHTFNLAISTHWSQLQNRLKTNLKLTFSVLMTSLHCPALTYTNRLLFQANLKRPPVFNLAATHTHTHTHSRSLQHIHSHPPGVGESCLWSRQEPRMPSYWCAAPSEENGNTDCLVIQDKQVLVTK